MRKYRSDTGSIMKCSKCGKEFMCYPLSHSYKAKNNRLFCSYTCYNSYLTELEKAFKEKFFK